MFGKNPKRKPITKYDGTLSVKEIIPTFQGEGPFVGRPAVFVRLGGCNLACKFCDTDFENFHSMSADDVVIEVEKKSILNGPKTSLVVITGGEPLRQPIDDLCNKLIQSGFEVQIETNGTLFRNLNEKVHIVCSPKVVNNKYLQINPSLKGRITALKFLVSTKVIGYADLPEYANTYDRTKIYVQPMDEINLEQNKQNMLHTLMIANKYGVNLCLQTHKIWNIY